MYQVSRRTFPSAAEEAGSFTVHTHDPALRQITASAVRSLDGAQADRINWSDQNTGHMEGRSAYSAPTFATLHNNLGLEVKYRNFHAESAGWRPSVEVSTNHSAGKVRALTIGILDQLYNRNSDFEARSGGGARMPEHTSRLAWIPQASRASRSRDESCVVQ